MRLGSALSGQISEVVLIRDQTVRLEVTRTRIGGSDTVRETTDMHFIGSEEDPDFDPALPMGLLQKKLLDLDEISLLNCTTLLEDIHFARTCQITANLASALTLWSVLATPSAANQEID